MGAEIRVLSVENLALTNVLDLSMDAPPTARNFALVLISAGLGIGVRIIHLLASVCKGNGSNTVC